MDAAPRLYVRENGRVAGPYTWEVVQRRVRDGEIGPETEVALQDPARPVAVPERFLPFAELMEQVQSSRDLRCASCGAEGAERRKISRVTSFVVVTSFKTTFDPLCPRCGARRAASMLAVTGLFGWWGIPWGLVRTPAALVTNASTLIRTRAFPKAAAILLTAVAFLVPVGVVVAVITVARAKGRADREAGRESIDQRAIRHIDAARKAQSRGDGKAALLAAQQAVSIAPDSWIARQEVANAQALLGHYAVAAESMREAVRLNPDNEELHADLVISLSFAEDLDGVEKEAAAMLARWPKTTAVYAARAEAHALRGRLDPALADLGRAPRATMMDLMALHAVAQASIEAGRAEKGLALVEQAEAAWKGEEEAKGLLRLVRSSLLCSLARFDEAVVVLDGLDLVAMGESSRRAIVALEKGEFEKAASLLDGVAAREDASASETADVHLWHGAALLRLGRNDDAKAAWTLAALPKGEKPTFEHVACAHLVTGSRLVELRAFATSPRSRRLANDVVLVEAMRLEVSDDRDGAVAAYRRCLDASPGSSFPGHLARRSADALAGR